MFNKKSLGKGTISNRDKFQHAVTLGSMNTHRTVSQSLRDIVSNCLNCGEFNYEFIEKEMLFKCNNCNAYISLNGKNSKND